MEDFLIDYNINRYIEFYLEYGSSFRYEINLNGNSVKFSEPNFSYSIKDGKIIFEGYIDWGRDNYSESKLIELSKKEDPSFRLADLPKSSRIKEWIRLRKRMLIPICMTPV